MRELAKVLGALGLLLIAGGADDGCTPKKDPKAEAAEKATKEAARAEVKTATPIEVTLPVLFKAYAENEIAADAKYKGKVLKVEAIVDHVRKGGPYVMFAFQRDGFRADFQTDEGLATLKNGDIATILCREDNEFGKPALADCILAK